MPFDERRPILDNTSTAGWYPIADLRTEDPPLYPAGVIEHFGTLTRAAVLLALG